MPYVSNMQDEEQKTDTNVAPQGAISPTGGGGGAVRLSPQSSVSPVGGSGTSSGTVAGAPGSAPSPAAGGSFASYPRRSPPVPPNSTRIPGGFPRGSPPAKGTARKLF